MCCILYLFSFRSKSLFDLVHVSPMLHDLHDLSIDPAPINTYKSYGYRSYKSPSSESLVESVVVVVVRDVDDVDLLLLVLLLLLLFDRS